MPRPPRLDLPGTQHHVMNRGARRQAIFLDEACHLAFLELLGHLPVRFGVEPQAYALMPNHFHLLLACPRGGLAQSMRYLQGGYARWLNINCGWDGPIWRARYRNRPVEDETYAAHLLAYIHLNPVKAHLAPSPEAAEWTSHAFYAGLCRPPEWLHTAEMAETFGSVEAYLRYIADVQMGRETGPEGFDPGELWQARPSACIARDPGEPAPPAPWPMSESEAWAALCQVTGLSRAALIAVGNGPQGNPARWLVFWWLPRATGRTQSGVARDFDLDRSVISRAGGRLRQAGRTDARVRRWRERLEELLPGSGS